VAVENLENPYANTFTILGNFVVPEAQNMKAFGSKKTRSHFVALGVRVLSAIDVDDERVREAHEIDDVAPDRLLSSEFGSRELATAEEAPHRLLCLGHVAAEAAGYV
jgi:hypothetical protein